MPARLAAVIALIGLASCTDSRPPADNSGVRFMEEAGEQRAEVGNNGSTSAAEATPHRLPESQRHAVYVKACAAEAEALQEADRQIPLTDAVSVHKQTDLQAKLRAQYIAKIATEYHVPAEDVEAISVEGRQSGWPTQ